MTRDSAGPAAPWRPIPNDKTILTRPTTSPPKNAGQNPLTVNRVPALGEPARRQQHQGVDYQGEQAQGDDDEGAGEDGEQGTERAVDDAEHRGHQKEPARALR